MGREAIKKQQNNPLPKMLCQKWRVRRINMGFFKRLSSLILGNSVAMNEKYARGLSKAKNGFKARLNALFARYRKIDEDFFEELESFLIESDVGGTLANEIVEAMKAHVRLYPTNDPKEIVDSLMEALYQRYTLDLEGTETSNTPPRVILVVGVNGVGKTTSIAKLAAMFQKKGKSVLLVAGDTFRAGAVEQLGIWSERLQVPLVKAELHSDPASVIYEGIRKGISRGSDVIICDTAGRLHTKTHLMNQLSKMKRVIEKQLGREPDEVLLVIDATTGQNGIQQAKAFAEATQVSGIILTKMDGTSRGGIILAIKEQLGLNVHYIGLGETLDDLVEFDINTYLHGLFAEMLE
jgi:fused signal recognition particle receptor